MRPTKTPINILERQIRTKLDDIGKRNVPVTKTEIWYHQVMEQCIILMDSTFGCSALAPRRGLPETLSELRVIYDCRTDIEQRLKKYHNYPEMFMLSNPPVPPPVPLDGIMLIRVRPDEIGLGNTETSYCSDVEDFWPKFFGKTNFLDEGDITIPSAIVATGEMRVHANFCGRTVDASKRIKEIADTWGVPLYTPEQARLKYSKSMGSS